MANNNATAASKLARVRHTHPLLRATMLAFALAPAPLALSQVAVYGAGTLSCGTWLQAKQKNASTYNAYRQWVAGYVVGVNYHQPPTRQAKPDWDATGAYIDRYCDKNPFSSLVAAAAALVQESGGPKAGHEWNK